MELFDLRAFADAAGVFNFKSHKPYVEKWFPWKTEKQERVSKFANLACLRDYAADFGDFVFAKIQPVVTDVSVARDFEDAATKVFYSLFLTRSAPKMETVAARPAKPELKIVETVIAPVAEVVAEEKPRKTLTLKSRAPETDIVRVSGTDLAKLSGTDLGEVFAQEMKKQAPSIAHTDTSIESPRKTLTLKTKVELSVISSLSKTSSTTDLAAAFKSEMKVITERKSETTDLYAAFTEKRKHPLSGKSWKELAAEAETLQPQKEVKGVDLGAAFRREMQAVLAHEERLSARPAAQQQTSQKIQKTRKYAA